MTYAVDECTRCPALVACRHQIVNGAGREDARILFVGQNPGQFEDKDGKPFVGRSGKLLALLCTTAGIALRDTYRTNAVRCWSPGNRKPTKEEVELCRPYLLEEIKQLKPTVIVTLGDTALQSLYSLVDPYDHVAAMEHWQLDCDTLLEKWNDDVAAWIDNGSPRGQKPKKTRMPSKPKAAKAQRVVLKDVAGTTLIQPDTGIPMVPSYHPAYLMRGKWEQADMVVEHFRKAQRIADGTQNAGQLGDYHVIDTVKKMRLLEDYLLSPEVKVINYDTETTGKNWKRDELICISLAGDEGEGFVVPILHNNNGTPEFFWLDDTDWTFIHQSLKRIFGSPKTKRGQNQLFDLRFLERKPSKFISAETAYGIMVNGPLQDTELLHHSIAESQPHNMTHILSSFTDMPFYEGDVKGKKGALIKLDDDIRHKYSAADADGLSRMWNAMRPIAKSEGVDWVLDNISVNLLRMCRALEDNGFPIDPDYFQSLCEFYDHEIAEEEKNLWAAVPTVSPGWKYNYPPALRDVLFKHLGLPKSGKKTDSSKGCEDCADGVCFEHDSTGKDALAIINDDHPHPCLPILLRLKNLTKRRSTYLHGGNGLGGFVKFISKDNRIHPTMKVSRAESGRLASEQPNGQNIPNYVHIHPKGYTCPVSNCTSYYHETFGLNTNNAFHDMVVAGPGKVILNADWSQLEVWVLAYRLLEDTGDRTLLDVMESGQDIHLWMARQMFPDLGKDLEDWEWKKTYDERRRRAKVLVFGTAYGLTAQGASGKMGVSVDEAQDYIDKYMAVVPGLRQYFRIIRQQLMAQGWIENVFGRRRHIRVLPLLKAMNANLDLEALLREAVNFPIQSGGSDLHSIASAATFNDPMRAARGCLPILSIHDSLTFEASAPDNEYIKQTAWLIKSLWEDIAWNTVRPNGQPLHWRVPVELEWGKRWGSPEWKLDSKGNLQQVGLLLPEEHEEQALIER